ncbi:hypothetical protein COLO4_04263 [Corchorus olitorius]|uniref:Uncharacterized protein n=1 Tax=Corchorus olitorius TaxID=93759 RepID=A0A1R3KUQ5_9ROSI|nr:hypothetical protein COLO4_04263 [Corchorus olitorius]
MAPRGPQHAMSSKTSCRGLKRNPEKTKTKKVNKLTKSKQNKKEAGTISEYPDPASTHPLPYQPTHHYTTTKHRQKKGKQQAKGIK